MRAKSKSSAAKLDAILLPGGERRTLWIVDGKFTFEPQRGAVELAPAGGFVLPGLVDAHTHADFPQEPLADGGRPAFVRRNLREFTGVGVLLLRDLGASSRTLDDLARRAGEPRVIPAGEALIGCANHCFPVTGPDHMVQHAVAQLRPGVKWVKIFTDWPDPKVEVDGKAQYFTDENPLTYAPELLHELVAAVHARGGRVASHVFTRRGAQVSVSAGVDTLEHGWGVTEDLFPAMIEQRIGWVPLAAIGPPMIELADRDERPDQRAWIEGCLRQLGRTLPAAVEAGVTLLTGTDWFPMITVADEINAFLSRGVPPAAALDAASGAARRFFGHRGLEEGAPADLVYYRKDPRKGRAVPAVPDFILLDGKPVTPARPAQPTPPPPREAGAHA